MPFWLIDAPPCSNVRSESGYSPSSIARARDLPELRVAVNNGTVSLLDGAEDRAAHARSSSVRGGSGLSVRGDCRGSDLARRARPAASGRTRPDAR